MAVRGLCQVRVDPENGGFFLTKLPFSCLRGGFFLTKGGPSLFQQARFSCCDPPSTGLCMKATATETLISFQCYASAQARSREKTFRWLQTVLYNTPTLQ